LVRECDVIFHLAANPEVRVGETSPQVHFEENILATFNLLESIRPLKEPKTIVFASTSTVYGDATQVPTPESYGPLQPISTYGASKLASEALITSYASTFNHKGLILRLANVIGPRANHGVIFDFIGKISKNPKRLEILGDGTQNKSYLYVDDCVGAIISLTSTFLNHEATVDIFNIGSKDQITVKEIAKIVARQMNAPGIEYAFTGGIDGGRGWKGDVKHMNLSIDKLLKTGWKPRYNSREAVELTATLLVHELVPAQNG
jgi:UDP-glucose 4-epimerase